MKEYDVVIIGGGIHGAGVLQAAAAAGHKALLIERSALASGTSSRSSKLIHGGLRYLESGQFALVRESLRERAIHLRVASELVTDERTVGLYLAGVEPMPLDRQLCLARFLIESVPSLSRQGHNLLARLRAEVAFARTDTVLHLTAPSPNSRTF